MRNISFGMPKNKKLPDLTMNDWMEAEKALGYVERPKNGKTRLEYAKEKGLGISAAGTRLKKMVDSGVLSWVKVQQSSGGFEKVYYPTKQNKNGNKPCKTKQSVITRSSSAR